MTPLAAVATYHERETPHQGRIPHGPVAIVARGQRAEIPDNGEFWPAVNAVTFKARGAGRRAVYRAVAYYASLSTARACFASVATIAERAGMGTTATRSQLRALERDGHLQAVGGRSGGRRGTRYTLILEVENPTVSVAQPNGKRWVNPTVSVAEVGNRERGDKGEPSKAIPLVSPLIGTQPSAAARGAAQPAPLTARQTRKKPGPDRRLVTGKGRTEAQAAADAVQRSERVGVPDADGTYRCRSCNARQRLGDWGTKHAPTVCGNCDARGDVPWLPRDAERIEKMHASGHNSAPYRRAACMDW